MLRKFTNITFTNVNNNISISKIDSTSSPEQLEVEKRHARMIETIHGTNNVAKICKQPSDNIGLFQPLAPKREKSAFNRIVTAATVQPTRNAK